MDEMYACMQYFLTPWHSRNLGNQLGNPDSHENTFSLNSRSTHNPHSRNPNSTALLRRPISRNSILAVSSP